MAQMYWIASEWTTLRGQSEAKRGPLMKKLLCVPVSKVFWQNVPRLKLQPTSYYYTIQQAKELVQDISRYCGYRVPKIFTDDEEERV
jgi:hypothetical protein